ncbi:MAG: hypothetical protein H6613_18495 [Ignavibacteriales bacterium]|nr:hypothetical protein [Ignavibacteriales bacterium]
MVLSEKRALAVKEWYVKNGIDFRRIKKQKVLGRPILLGITILKLGGK